jgi:peptidoglycan/LPS O-acetylase OafA/YrhL
MSAVPEQFAVPAILGASSTSVGRAEPNLRADRQAAIRYENLDYLRLSLAVEVVALHLYAGLTMGGSLWVPIPPVAAFVGLSGFLIPQSLERSRDLRHFARKRMLRTLPALVPLLAAIALVFGFGSTLGAMIQYLTAGYLGRFQGVTLPLWSLIVEDALYACMAGLFVFGAHRSVWVTLPILAALLFGEQYVTDSMTKYRLFDTSIAFFTGNLIYILHSRVRNLSWIWPAVVVTACIAGWVDILGAVEFPVLIGSVVVLAMTLPQIPGRIPDLSYGIYIWHAPILMALLNPVGMARDKYWVFATSALTVIAALCSWYLVEKKALSRKNWRPGEVARAGGQSAVAVAKPLPAPDLAA